MLIVLTCVRRDAKSKVGDFIAAKSELAEVRNAAFRRNFNSVTPCTIKVVPYRDPTLDSGG